MNFDFTIFLNKVAMGMVEDHPLAHWLELEQPDTSDVNEWSLLNEKQMHHLEEWITYQLSHAKTWGNA
ncbi:MAG: hypothetical protein K9N34_02900 [Candidatus Marinimicrobia bacterium]|nr:hypothetical protein [Candidatus Neomarinimicrobiota bacterium]MCF7839469.1 hypothetical protein [Candidatus Neomarinimicrobiota bacterium]